MVPRAKLASAKCIAVFVCFCLLFVLVIYFSLFLFFDCLFNWSTEMAVLT